MYKKIALLSISAAMVFLSGCSLLPKEESFPAAPVAETYVKDEYVKVQVERGDIIDQVSISCTYQAARAEDIKYPADGAVIEEMYVEIGDLVKAGDLVALLDTGTLPEQIKETEEQIGELALNLRQEKESKELSENNRKALAAAMREAGQEEQASSLEIPSDYNKKIRELEEELYIKEKYRDELAKKMEACRIRAGIGGTVSYIFRTGDKEKIRTDVTLMKIVDSSSCYFVAEGAEKGWFTEKEKVVIHMKEGDYTAKITDAGTSMAGEKAGEIYLLPELPDPALTAGSTGTIYYIRQQKENVLYLPSKGVIESDKGYFVYIEDPDGLKTVREIETGLIAGGKTEIISGLKEGDSIILE